MRGQRGRECCGPSSKSVCSPEHGPLSSEFGDGGGGEELRSLSSAAQGRHGGNRGEPSIWTFSRGWENRGPRDQRSHCSGGGDGAGLHSLQETVGCEIREDSCARGFRLLYFDGKLLLSCYPEANGCALPQSSARTLAMEMEKSWDIDGFLSKHYRAHVQGELCGRLRGYLESWTGFMERTGTDPGPGPSSAPILKPPIPTCPRRPSLSSGRICGLFARCPGVSFLFC